MARTNKYNSTNFNDIYEKKLTSAIGAKPSSSSSKSLLSNSISPSSPISKSYFHSSSAAIAPGALYQSHAAVARNHGRMLVLTRPSPKPISVPQISPKQTILPKTPDQSRSDPSQSKSESEPISLRPLGKTGTGPALLNPAPVLTQKRDKEGGILSVSPKPEKFVPPHLRPGFVAKEERFGSEVQRQVGFGAREGANRKGHYGTSSSRYCEEARPKSGGGYDKARRGGSGFAGGESDLRRPLSSGNRPSSS